MPTVSMPSVRFVKIAQALWGEDPMESGPLLVFVGVLSEEIIDPYEVMGSAMTVTWLH